MSTQHNEKQQELSWTKSSFNTNNIQHTNNKIIHTHLTGGMDDTTSKRFGWSPRVSNHQRTITLLRYHIHPSQSCSQQPKHLPSVVPRIALLQKFRSLDALSNAQMMSLLASSL